MNALEVGTIVEHKHYPGQTGRVMGKAVKWPGLGYEFILVRWEQTTVISSHLRAALSEVVK